MAAFSVRSTRPRAQQVMAPWLCSCLQCSCTDLGAEPGLRHGGVPCLGHGAAAQVCWLRKGTCPQPSTAALDHRPFRTGLLLLLSHFGCVQLCSTPQIAAHQAPPSLGFSRQEHWSGLPFPSPMRESEKWKWSRSVMSDSYRPHGLQPTRLLHPWDFPGKSTGVGCHCLLRNVWQKPQYCKVIILQLK